LGAGSSLGAFAALGALFPAPSSGMSSWICVYWTTTRQSVNHLRAVPKIGGDPITIAPVDMFGEVIAADDTGVYWGERETHRLMRATR
jgi:hypothetical protein